MEVDTPSDGAHGTAVAAAQPASAVKLSRKQRKIAKRAAADAAETTSDPSGANDAMRERLPPWAYRLISAAAYHRLRGAPSAAASAMSS